MSSRVNCLMILSSVVIRFSESFSLCFCRRRIFSSTVFLVMKAQFLAPFDIFDLYVDPLPGAAEPLQADAELSGFNLGATNFLYINNAGGWTIDEIRIGSTFAAVTPTSVPEPASLLLVMMGLAAIALARRRGATVAARRSHPQGRRAR